MSLVQRQTPEQLESYTRRNFRRAAIGVAACIGSLLGIGAATTAAIAHEVAIVQDDVQHYLMPKGTQPSQTASTPGGGANNQMQPVSNVKELDSGVQHFHAEAVRVPSDRDNDWAVSLGTIAGASAVSMGALLALGSARRRRLEENGDSGAEPVDIETTEDYGLYGFELDALAAEQRMHDGLGGLESLMDGMDTRVHVLDEETSATLMATRLHDFKLNWPHAAALHSVGGNPLEAFTYPAPATYLEAN